MGIMLRAYLLYKELRYRMIAAKIHRKYGPLRASALLNAPPSSEVYDEKVSD